MKQGSNDDPPADPKFGAAAKGGTEVKTKRSTTNGEGRLKCIAALTEHHIVAQREDDPDGHLIEDGNTEHGTEQRGQQDEDEGVGSP